MSTLLLLLDPPVAPDSVVSVAARKVPTAQGRRNCAAANKARHAKTVAKYQAVMGKEWVKTSLIEARRGVARTACYETLMKYLKMGLLERRPIGGKLTKNKGHEWRWK